jgi:hypothetical protein
MLDRTDRGGINGFRLRIWTAEPGRGTPLLWARSRQTLWAYFGGQNPCATTQDALSEPWIRAFLADPHIAEQLSGVFGLVAVDLTSGRIAAACDRLGVQGIYFIPEGPTVSCIGTHLMWLLLASRHDGAADDDACLEHFSFGYTVSGTQTFYRNVHRLPPASYLSISDDRMMIHRYWHHADSTELPATEEVAGQLGRAMQPWAPDSGLFLPLTAGKDSLCLAALSSPSNLVRTGTFGCAESADRLQGHALADALHVRHVAVDVCDASSLDRWINHVAFHTAGLATASYADMARFVECAVPGRTPVVLGEGGECVRDFFSRPEGPVAALSGDYMTAAPLLSLSLHSRLRRRLGDYPASMINRVREPVRHLDDEAFALHFYRQIRMPGNFSQRQAVLTSLRPKVSPFLDRQFIAAAYGLPRSWFVASSLHRAIVGYARPEWLTFFDNPPSSTVTTQGWRERVAGDAGSALARVLNDDLEWCDDVFDASGVRELRRVAEGNERAVYHLLRVVSFAAGRRILRAAPGEHLSSISSQTEILADLLLPFAETTVPGGAIPAQSPRPAGFSAGADIA